MISPQEEPTGGTRVWTLARAKAKFSEVLDRAQAEGPQTVTRNVSDFASAPVRVVNPWV